MCSADLTPIPTRWYPQRNRTYVDSDVVHTCRNFPKIRSWLSERVNGSLAVQHFQHELRNPCEILTYELTLVVVKEIFWQSTGVKPQGYQRR